MDRDRDDAGIYGLRTGNGIEITNDLDLDENYTEIVNVPVMPTRRGFCVRNLGVFHPGCEILVEREDSLPDRQLYDRAVVRKIDRSRNLLELESPTDFWPMMGGFVHKILGFNRHYINVKQMEQVKKLINAGGVLLDESLLNGKDKEEVLETLDC